MVDHLAVYVQTLEHGERLATVLVRAPVLKVHVRVEMFVVFALSGELLIAVCVQWWEVKSREHSDSRHHNHLSAPKITLLRQQRTEVVRWHIDHMTNM